MNAKSVHQGLPGLLETVSWGLAAAILLIAVIPAFGVDEEVEPATQAALTPTLLWEVKAWDSSIIDFGRSVAPVGDINGDGKWDIVVGAPYSAQGGGAFILSGADGSVLRAYHGHDVAYGAHFGYSVSPAGDFNLDGTYDILVGAMSMACGACELGYAQVLSGAEGCPDLGPQCILMTVTGSTPYEMFGASVAAVGDLDGDNRTDILVGAPGVGNGYPGAARLFSSEDGSIMVNAYGEGADNLGASVAAVGDATGDGTPDFMIGAPGADPGGISNAGRAYLYSGATSQVKRVWSGKQVSQSIGRCVAGAGRVNRDRYADIILGVPGATAAGVRIAGRVRVHSGRDGALLFKRNGTETNGSMGYSAAAAGDVNGDGYGDVLVGSPGIGGSDGRVQLISGKGDLAKILWTYDGGYRDGVGYSMAVADANGDGKPDVVIGGWGWNYGSGTGSGYVRVYTFAP
jgi:hypothetical protein